MIASESRKRASHDVDDPQRFNPAVHVEPDLCAAAHSIAREQDGKVLTWPDALHLLRCCDSEAGCHR